MKILSIGNFSNASWDGSIPDEEHIAKALEDLGHTVDRWQREQTGPGGMFGTSGEMPPKYDFILIAQWDGYPEDFRSVLKRVSDYPIVYWAFDYQADGQEWHERLVNEADVYLSKPLSDMRKHKNWRFLSQDFAPEFLDKATDINVGGDKDIDVLFTGSWVPWESGKERVKYLKAIDERFNLQINSVTPAQWKAEGFKNVEGPVMDHDLPALIARAKINISMDHVWSPGYWSDRNAQIMCCGGFVLFRHVPLSEAVFKEKVAYFHTIDECLEKIDYYLKNPEERERIAERGYKCAVKHMKVGSRVKELLTILGEFL